MNEWQILALVGTTFIVLAFIIAFIQGRIELKRQREELRKALRGHCEGVVSDDKNI